jgi:hypothetical protein
MTTVKKQLQNKTSVVLLPEMEHYELNQKIHE